MRVKVLNEVADHAVNRIRSKQSDVFNDGTPYLDVKFFNNFEVNPRDLSFKREVDRHGIAHISINASGRSFKLTASTLHEHNIFRLYRPIILWKTVTRIGEGTSLRITFVPPEALQ